MQNATIHIRLFGLVYDNPKQGDIPCGIDVRVHIVPAMLALERLVISFTDMVAMAASLRSIGRFNDNQLNTRDGALVCEKRSELSEVPGVKFSLESLVSPLCGTSDVAEVFDSEADASILGLGNDSLGYGVVDYRCCGLLSSTKPFQEPLASPCAFGLDGTTDSKSLCAILVECIGGVGSTFGRTDNIRNSEVKPYNLFRGLSLGFGNIYCLIQEELPFFVGEVSLPLNVGDILLVVTSERHLLSFLCCPDGYTVILIGEDACIVTDAAVCAELTLLLVVELVRIGYLAYTACNHLCGEVELLPYIMVAEVVNLELVERAVLPSHIGYISAGPVGFLHRCEEKPLLLLCRENLDFQYQFHVANLRKIICLVLLFNLKKRDVAQFRPLS